MRARDLVQSSNRTFKLTGYTADQVTGMMKDVGKQFAEELNKQGMAHPASRNRHDVGPIQIDQGVVRDVPSKPEPVVILSFDTHDNLGIKINIKMIDFLQNPKAYADDIFKHLAPMRRNALRLRRDTKAFNERVYNALTEVRTNG